MGRIDSLSGAKRPGFRDTSNTGGHDTDQDQQKKAQHLELISRTLPKRKKPGWTQLLVKGKKFTVKSGN